MKIYLCEMNDLPRQAQRAVDRLRERNTK
jgi:hypothetical protein